jgi:uncharacterized protein YicC (UPF0701 family)
MDPQQFTLKDGQALEKFLLTRIEALEKMAKIANDSIEKAVSVAHNAMNERLNTMNEFRDSLRDQNTLFITKVEHQALCDRIDRQETEIRGLRESRAELNGKASQGSVDTARTMALIGVAVSIISIILKFVG